MNFLEFLNEQIKLCYENGQKQYALERAMLDDKIRARIQDLTEAYVKVLEARAKAHPTYQVDEPLEKVMEAYRPATPHPADFGPEDDTIYAGEDDAIHAGEGKL